MGICNTAKILRQVEQLRKKNYNSFQKDILSTYTFIYIINIPVNSSGIIVSRQSCQPSVFSRDLNICTLDENCEVFHENLQLYHATKFSDVPVRAPASVSH